MADNLIGNVRALALRSKRFGPMLEVEQVEAVEGQCLDRPASRGGRRGITLLAAQQWQQVLDELAVDLPWHSRRANVLIDTVETLAPLIGQTVQIGPVGVRVYAETDPCAEMDQIYPGLKSALTPDCRGGVYGQVLNGGTIRVGDSVTCEGGWR